MVYTTHIRVPPIHHPARSAQAFRGLRHAAPQDAQSAENFRGQSAQGQQPQAAAGWSLMRKKPEGTLLFMLHMHVYIYIIYLQC